MIFLFLWEKIRLSHSIVLMYSLCLIPLQVRSTAKRKHAPWFQNNTLQSFLSITKKAATLHLNLQLQHKKLFLTKKHVYE